MTDDVEKFTGGRDSIDSETCDSVVILASRNSFDLADSEHEKSSEVEDHGTCRNVPQNSDISTSPRVTPVEEDRTTISVDSAKAESSVTSNEGEVSGGESVAFASSDKSEVVKGAGPVGSECDSIQEQRQLADSDMESRQQEVESELEEGEINDDSVEESMEVDSTEDSAIIGDVGEGNKHDNKLALCDSTSSKVDENKMVSARVLQTVQADSGSSSGLVTPSVSEVKEAAVVDSSTDRGRTSSESDRVAVLLADQSTDSDYGSSRTDLLNSSNQEVDASNHLEESLVESVSDFSEPLRHSSSSSAVSLDTSGEKVGSSSDEKTRSSLSDVSSSSERRNLDSSDCVQSAVSSQTVDDFQRNFASSDSPVSSVVSSVVSNVVSSVVSSQSSDSVGVSSTELVCASDTNMVGNSGTADSSEAVVSSKSDTNEVYQEDSLPSVTGSGCLDNTSEADTPSIDECSVMSEELGNTGEASSSSSVSEDPQLASSSVNIPSEPPPLPIPTKKKVRAIISYVNLLKIVI